MKRYLFGILCLWAFWGAGAADERPELWFPVGEQLLYRVYWGVVPVGTSRATTEWVERDGETLLAIRFETRSYRVLDPVYPVDDTIESLIDPETFLPVRHESRMNQGRRSTHEITYFDYDRLMAKQYVLHRDSTNYFQLEPDTRDLVSFMYYMRKKAFTVGNKTQYRVMADDKTYDLWVNARRVEPVRLSNYGRVDSVRIEPEAAFEGFLVRRGEATFWVSEDDRRIITRMTARIPVAHIRMILRRVRGPGDDFWVQEDDPDEGDEDDDLFEGNSRS